MKTNLAGLREMLSDLIYGGATEITLKFEGGPITLGWRFPDQPGECMLLELEEVCSSGSSC